MQVTKTNGELKMSHYTVLVIGDNVDKKLAPFHEFECTGLSDEFVQDIDITDQYKTRQEVEDDGIKIVYDEKDIDRAGSHKYGYAVISGSSVVKAVRRTNPNKKWDWYVIGGRWTGLLQLKKGAKGMIGEPGILSSRRAEEGTADRAKTKDIDWESMRKGTDELKEYYSQRWDACMGLIKADFSKFGILYKKEWMLARYGTKEEYIRRECEFKTYAVITEDGKWNAPGEMGWFGFSSEEHAADKLWDEMFFDHFIKNLDPETMITIVDCHI